MKYSVIVTGSTGMVGKGILIECLEHDAIERVLVVNRILLNLKHAKLKELIIPDFMNLKDVKSELEGYDACFFSLGISSIGISKKDYERTTFDLTTHFAKTFLSKNDNSVFTYVTGSGTNSFENGKAHWANVKGKTENFIINQPFRASYMFRPGYIHPYKGVGSKTVWVKLLYLFFGLIYQVLKFFPATATNSINMGKAMIYCLINGNNSNILNNNEINKLANKL